MISPPGTRASEHVDVLHGTKVTDPYRWLEDLDSEETAAWVAAQSAYSESLLAQIPERAALRERIGELWNYERTNLVARRGDRFFFMHNDGLLPQPVLTVRDGIDGPSRVLLDPNTLSDDGTVALTGLTITLAGDKLAYGLSTAGTDWQEWRTRDVATGEDLGDLVRWVKFSSAPWLADGSGFFYCRFPEEQADTLEQTVQGHQLYLHRLGTDQGDDQLIWQQPEHPDWIFGPQVTRDGRYLVVSAAPGAVHENAVYVAEFDGATVGPIRPLIPELDAGWSFVENDGTTMWFTTSKDAPKSRLVSVDATTGAVTEVVGEADDTLLATALIADRFVLLSIRDAASVIRTHARDGSAMGEVALPDVGDIVGLVGEREDGEAYLTFTGFTSPASTLRHDFATGETEVVLRPSAAFDPEAFTTSQVFVTSRDGTQLPMFLVHGRDVVADGTAPVLLTSYGGYSIPMTPAFSARNIAWLERGGVFAQPCLRGGNEYGEDWHMAGTREHKQNVFDDFIASAEWLIANGWTTPDRIAIEGGSNGGLLVGACMVQRPDLFGAVVPRVGVLDMLRFHKFTVGWAWVPEYGDPDVAEDFAFLYAYSPLHNITPDTAYPATLVVTGDHDDRVVPSHSFKFTAALQAAQGGDAPIAARIETRAGHGLGKPTQKLIDEGADILAWMVAHTRGT